jgi:hypothetical protein
VADELAASAQGEEREREREMCQQEADASSHSPTTGRNDLWHVCSGRTHAKTHSLVHDPVPLPRTFTPCHYCERPAARRPDPNQTLCSLRHAPTRGCATEATIDIPAGVVKPPAGARDQSASDGLRFEPPHRFHDGSSPEVARVQSCRASTGAMWLWMVRWSSCPFGVRLQTLGSPRVCPGLLLLIRPRCSRRVSSLEI